MSRLTQSLLGLALFAAGALILVGSISVLLNAQPIPWLVRFPSPRYPDKTIGGMTSVLLALLSGLGVALIYRAWLCLLDVVRPWTLHRRK